MQTSTSTGGHDIARQGSTLEVFFAGGKVDMTGLARHLDGLEDSARASATRSMTARQQAKVFEAARGVRALDLDDFVPAGTPPLVQVIHSGKNSLPFFKTFEKRFCRPELGSARLWGYNENPRSITSVTGPGYFVCYSIGSGEVLIDYCEVPPNEPKKPDGWPPVLPNSAGLSRFIYNRTQDTMRGVSKHVSVGRAARDGRVMDNWFVLCRRG
jgi:hypothetical protein